MSARYRLLLKGVFDTASGETILPRSGEAWEQYRAWMRAGNTPDPYVAPPDDPETLDHAKARRIAELKAAGVARMQARFPAIADFDTAALVRQIVLSIAPAARALTADIAWLGTVWQAGADGVAAVRAATTVAAVDAVTVAWPAA